MPETDPNFESMLRIFQSGSIPIETILELLNLDTGIFVEEEPPVPFDLGAHLRMPTAWEHLLEDDGL